MGRDRTVHERVPRTFPSNTRPQPLRRSATWGVGGGAGFAATALAVARRCPSTTRFESIRVSIGAVVEQNTPKKDRRKASGGCHQRDQVPKTRNAQRNKDQSRRLSLSCAGTDRGLLPLRAPEFRREGYRVRRVPKRDTPAAGPHLAGQGTGKTLVASQMGKHAPDRALFRTYEVYPTKRHRRPRTYRYSAARTERRQRVLIPSRCLGATMEQEQAAASSVSDRTAQHSRRVMSRRQRACAIGGGRAQGGVGVLGRVFGSLALFGGWWERRVTTGGMRRESQEQPWVPGLGPVDARAMVR